MTDAKASYQAAQAVVQQSNVRAPFAGTVYSLPVSQTEFVQQGQLLLQMADLSKLQSAHIKERDIGALAVRPGSQYPVGRQALAPCGAVM